MKDHSEIEALLPFYAAGSLAPAERQAVKRHLDTCETCRADLALWQSLGKAVQAAGRSTPVPEGLLENALGRIRAQGNRPQPWLAQKAIRLQVLLCSQILLVRREIWLASALVMVLGWTAAVLLNSSTPFQLVAPLVAAAGVVMIYGPENDPGIEVAMATVTSQRQILLVRLTLVFSYNLLLALAFSLVLLPFFPNLVFGPLILSWLAPMTFLSGGALLLSLWIGTDRAAMLTYLIWLARVIAFGTRVSSSTPMPRFVEYILLTFGYFWDQPQALLGLGVLLAGAAIWKSGLNNPRLMRRP